MSERQRDPLRDLCVVVPIGAGERMWRDLLNDLVALPEGSEVVLVGPGPVEPEEMHKFASRGVFNVRYLECPLGRAMQMNRAAYSTSKKYLWFLHADTKIPKPAFVALRSALSDAPEALHYFQLRFLDDGPRLVGLNKWGANWRSHLFGLPFGHQGFALSRDQFLRIGSFDEDVLTGEDQVFVFEAHRKRIPVRAVASAIFTSARRYEAEGWSRATRHRVWASTKQAIGEYFKLMRIRMLS